jgi:hypothetical protein
MRLATKFSSIYLWTAGCAVVSGDSVEKTAELASVGMSCGIESALVLMPDPGRVVDIGGFIGVPKVVVVRVIVDMCR